MDVADAHLHSVLLQHMEEVRKRLSDANIGSTFSVTIKLEGRLNSSDPLKVAYKLAQESWHEGPEGNALTPVVDEFLRRLGWNQRYAPVALPPPEPVIEPPPMPDHGAIVINTVRKNPDDDIPL